MKKVILALLFGLNAQASMFDSMTKEELSDYEIVVVKKSSGKVVGKMSRAEYKVVKIEEKAKAAEVTTTTETKTVAKTVTKEEKKNSVILHVGVGNDGLSHDYDAGTYKVSERRAPVAGATICRNLVENKGVCGSAFSNSTFTLGVKLDF